MSLYTLSPMNDRPEDGVHRPTKVTVRQVAPNETAEKTVAVIEETFGGHIVVYVTEDVAVTTVEPELLRSLEWSRSMGDK